MGEVILRSLNVGCPKQYRYEGRSYITSIEKTPVGAAVRLGLTDFEGNRQGDLEAHGGPDKAACCYCLAHYGYWRRRLERQTLSYGAFGENCTLDGVTEREVCIGDVFELGSAIVQVTQPRSPCRNLAMIFQEPRIIRWIIETGFCGFYFRVRQEGLVQAGDRLRLLERPHPDMTVVLAHEAAFLRPEDLSLAARLADLEALSQSWKGKFRQRLATARDAQSASS